MADTWLCTFKVSIDLPTTLTPHEMESIVAQCMAVRLTALGYAGNCVVTLVATAGNVSVLDGPDIDGGVVRVDSPGQVGKLPGPVPVPIAESPVADVPANPPGTIPDNPIGAV